MKRKLIAVLTCFAVLAMWLPYRGAAEQDKAKTAAAKIMEEKLKTSQKILEGIALADYKKITANAEDLIHLTNLAEWKIHKTPKFELFTNEFRRAAENVISKAKTKNIDGVTLAYFELTMSCVRCHEYVREIRDAGP